MRHRASETGDVKGVLEKIGDKLEACLGGMIPKCGKCSGPFQSSENMVMAGMVKFHKYCPSPEDLSKQLAENAGASSQISAVLSAPGLLTIRVEAACGQMLTFFFAKATVQNGPIPESKISSIETSIQASLATQITYCPDDSAHSKSKRKLKGALSESCQPPMVSAGGNDSFAAAPGVMVPDPQNEQIQILRALILKTNLGLSFTAEVTFSWDESTRELEARTLILSVTITRHELI
jgi:hypothetical protein